MTSQPEPGGTSRRNRITTRILLPVQEFISTEAAGGVALLIAAGAALVWANVAADSYQDFWQGKLSFDLGIASASESLQHWVNNALMTVFFFVVALEIKREVLHGELAEPRKASLPVAAAIGGMVVPALIYTAVNAGGEGRHGWGIPMATDIAFALGVLALLGDRIPSSLRIFLLAVAVVDDLGSILVIAVFYTESLQFDSLAIAVLTIGVIVAVQSFGVRNFAVYVFLGVALWLAIYESGVSATIAGVILGLLTPSRPYVTREGFAERSDLLVRQYNVALASEDNERVEAVLGEIEETAANASAPLERLERLLHPWSSFVVVPIIALANAGVELSSDTLIAASSSTITLGILLRPAGKVIGIALATWLTTRLQLGRLPDGVTWINIIGVALLAGIGFTVSLFITDLAFESANLIDEAKIGIFGSSLIAGVLGLVFLRITAPSAEQAKR